MNRRWRELVDLSVCTADVIRAFLPEEVWMVGYVKFHVEFGRLGGARWGAAFEYRVFNGEPLTFDSAVLRPTPEGAARTLIREAKRASRNSLRAEVTFRAMTIDQLNNAIAYSLSHGAGRRQRVQALRAELARRGT